MGCQLVYVCMVYYRYHGIWNIYQKICKLRIDLILILNYARLKNECDAYQVSYVYTF